MSRALNPGRLLLGVNSALVFCLLAFNLLVEPGHSKAYAVQKTVVGAVVGQVQVRTKMRHDWLPIKVGLELKEGDEIRTAGYSEVTLHLPDSSSVVISSNTTFVVGEEVVQVSSFELGQGRISAAISKENSRIYRFRSKGSDAVASTRQGEFSLSNDGQGSVAVVARKGEVKLRAKGRQVTVPKGMQALVPPNQPPGRVMAIPSSLALQVHWPKTKLDSKQTRISGKTSAGATLLINGIVVRADHRGSFALDVPLQEGKNKFVVTATDMTGKSAQTKSPEITVDTQPPEIQVRSEGLWK